jgi:hypothetical protein
LLELRPPLGLVEPVLLLALILWLDEEEPGRDGNEESRCRARRAEGRLEPICFGNPNRPKDETHRCEPESAPAEEQAVLAQNIPRSNPVHPPRARRDDAHGRSHEQAGGESYGKSCHIVIMPA